MLKKILVSAAVFSTTLSGSLALPVLADGMDFFFHSNAGGGIRQHAITPFPNFPSASSAKVTALPRPMIKGGVSSNESDSLPQNIPSAVPTKSNTSPAKLIALPPSVIKTGVSNNATDNLPTKEQALIWFEKFDDIVFTMGASDHEKYILKRPINKEVERLNEYIDATNSLAKKYRAIAKSIRTMRLSQSVSDLKEFQLETAGWYDDSAQICEELTEPRRPAKTYEEVERTYRDFVNLSKNLAEVSKSICELSTKLRQKYDVHQPKYKDESFKYINAMAHQI